ncbi:hypothetical protein JHK87_042783 [Glycine soja]|nr:hypothetical protein JHK87_042783 [Glycine soja]
MKIEELDDGECSRDEEKKCQRQIVSIDAKRSLVGAGVWILFYPTLLYNVLRNQIEFLLLGTVPFPNDVPHLKKVGVGGVITLNEPYETLVQLYQAFQINYGLLCYVGLLQAKAVLHEVIRLAPKLHESYHTLGLVYTSL